MLKYVLCYAAMLGILAISPEAQAEVFTLSINYPSNPNLMGVNLYQVYYDAENPPEAQYILDNYQTLTRCEAFSAAEVASSALDRGLDCQVYLDPEQEAPTWVIELIRYFSPAEQEPGQILYFVATVFSFAGEESGPSNVVSSANEWPGKPGTPNVYGSPPPAVPYSRIKAEPSEARAPVIPADGGVLLRIERAREAS